MSLVCVASQKGSPGATLTSLLVAGMWPKPSERKLVVEADPSGGSLAATYQLSLDPDLSTLAAAVDRGIPPKKLWKHTQLLPGSTSAVVSPINSDDVHRVLDVSGKHLGRWLEDIGDIDVFADVGRLSLSSPSLQFVSASSAVLMVARPVLEQLQAGAERLKALAESVPKVGWVLVGDQPYGPAEVEATYGFDVLAVLADDAQTADAVEQGSSLNRLSNTPLLRTVDKLVSRLHEDLAGSAIELTSLSVEITGETKPASGAGVSSESGGSPLIDTVDRVATSPPNRGEPASPSEFKSSDLLAETDLRPNSSSDSGDAPTGDVESPADSPQELVDLFPVYDAEDSDQADVDLTKDVPPDHEAADEVGVGDIAVAAAITQAVTQVEDSQPERLHTFFPNDHRLEDTVVVSSEAPETPPSMYQSMEVGSGLKSDVLGRIPDAIERDQTVEGKSAHNTGSSQSSPTDIFPSEHPDGQRGEGRSASVGMGSDRLPWTAEDEDVKPKESQEAALATQEFDSAVLGFPPRHTPTSSSPSAPLSITEMMVNGEVPTGENDVPPSLLGSPSSVSQPAPPLPPDSQSSNSANLDVPEEAAPDGRPPSLLDAKLSTPTAEQSPTPPPGAE